MTAAKVQFLDQDGEPVLGDEKPARFSFDCVRLNKGRDPRLPALRCANLLLAVGPHTSDHGIKRDGQNANGGRAQWDWDGNRESPTIAPSINCSAHCGWHGYIRAGRCVDASGRDET